MAPDCTTTNRLLRGYLVKGVFGKVWIWLRGYLVKVFLVKRVFYEGGIWLRGYVTTIVAFTKYPLSQSPLSRTMIMLTLLSFSRVEQREGEEKREPST